MPAPVLLLAQLVVVLAAARLLGSAARRAGQPRVVGEMVAGLALGPSLLGIVAPRALATLFPPERLGALSALSHAGILLFLFVVGLRLDTGSLRARARTAVVTSHASIVVPFALGAALAPVLPPSLAGAAVSPLAYALFLGAAMSVTAFPVLARILAEQQLLRTPLGALAITCAAVDDVTAWGLLAGVVALAGAGGAWTAVAATLARAALVLAVAWAARPLLRRVAGRLLADRAIWRLVALGVTAAGALALATHWAGVHALFGAFVAGALMPRDAGAAAIADRLESAVATLLVPLFFALTGLRTSVGLVSGAAMWGAFALLLAVAVVGKLGASAVAARLTGLAWRDALAIGALMNTRGLMALVILNAGLELGAIAPPLFAMMVLVAMATTLMTSPLVRRLVAPAG